MLLFMAEFIFASVGDLTLVNASAICSVPGIHSNKLTSPHSTLSLIQLIYLRVPFESGTLPYSFFRRLSQSQCMIMRRLSLSLRVSVIISLMNTASVIEFTTACISASYECRSVGFTFLLVQEIILQSAPFVRNIRFPSLATPPTLYAASQYIDSVRSSICPRLTIDRLYPGVVFIIASI